MMHTNKELQNIVKTKGINGAIAYCTAWRDELDEVKKELEEQSETMDPEELKTRRLELNDHIQEFIKIIRAVTGR
jgi:uncharacterized protein YdcH (DUF465 family)